MQVTSKNANRTKSQKRAADVIGNAVRVMRIATSRRGRTWSTIEALPTISIGDGEPLKNQDR
jgi:hypothetical protein